MFIYSFIVIAPNEKMAEVLTKTIKEAKDIISKVGTDYSFHF